MPDTKIALAGVLDPTLLRLTLLNRNYLFVTMDLQHA